MGGHKYVALNVWLNRKKKERHLVHVVHYPARAVEA